MNILYFSHLNNLISEGPNYSVPAQISAQSKYDNVFWLNLTDACQKSWVETGLFHSIKEYPNKDISLLPEPFNKPDLVVFESFYYLDDVLLSIQCQRMSIPYIIVPRSAFTWQGQAKKKLKKKIANFLFFSRMAKNALAIQYLTKDELIDSGNLWNKNSFVIPNGILINEFKTRKKDRLNGVYIGRFDIYQKGLDLLFKACKASKRYLEDNNMTITLYGPERLGLKQKYADDIIKNGLEKVLKVGDGVFGEEKERVLKDASFFIMTSRFEGMPMSLIEALSYGLPCVASKGTNMSDVVKEHNAGWVCDNSVTSIQIVFKEIMECDDFESKSENAYNLSRKYDWDSISMRTHEIYSKLLIGR